MAQDPYRYFRLEARELLDQFGATILDLEKSESGAEQVQRLLRLAHTLKGAARVVKQPEIADRAHAIEDTLSAFRDTAGKVPRAQIESVLADLDGIDGRVRALTPSEAADMPAGRQPGGDDNIRTVRTEIAEVDALLEGVAEAHVLLGGLRAATRSIEQSQRLADLLAEQLAARGEPEAPRQLSTATDTAYALADDLRRSFGALERNLDFSIDQIDRELRQLRDAAEQLRLVRAGALFMPLERTARDTAQAMAKQIVFEGKGGDIRLDADILATVQGALVQIVRNAVAHGIEPESERRAAGKPAAGRVALDISRRGRQVVFACRDDGRGVDLDAVRRVALQRGLTASAVRRLSTEDLVRLLLRGGISTSDAVTEVAGRGIGLDVVREAAARLGGTVAVETEPGKGTRIELSVPLSLLSLDVLMVEAAGTLAALPLDAVRGSMRFTASEVTRNSGGAVVLYDHKAIPFLWLPRALGDASPPSGRAWSAIVIAASGGTVAVGVDRLLETARVVVHPLPEFAPATALVAGAYLDAEGNPKLVLDPDGLVAAARYEGGAVAETVPARRPILIVDDSLTTRMLEQGILESAGYEVDAAISAEDGLALAQRKRYAAFLVDVEMPGMDGFSFVERIRADPVLHDIPAVLVTSRAAPADRRRGSEVGARGYIVKSEFDQSKLLALIRQLVE